MEQFPLLLPSCIHPRLRSPPSAIFLPAAEWRPWWAWLAFQGGQGRVWLGEWAPGVPSCLNSPYWSSQKSGPPICDNFLLLRAPSLSKVDLQIESRQNNKRMILVLSPTNFDPGSARRAVRSNFLNSGSQILVYRKSLGRFLKNTNSQAPSSPLIIIQ